MGQDGSGGDEERFLLMAWVWQVRGRDGMTVDLSLSTYVLMSQSKPDTPLPHMWRIIMVSES